jgi:hypothetical protein
MNLNTYKKIDNIILISVGAGMFLWLALVSFLHLVIFMILRNSLIMTEVDPLVIFWTDEIVYLVLFLILTLWIFNWIKRNPIEKFTATRILKYSIIALIIIQVIQFVLGCFALDILITKFPMLLDNYQNATEPGYLISITAGLELVLYIVLGILVFKKSNCC